MASDDEAAHGGRDLFDDVFDRASALLELDGPRIEAWVSGLMTLFDDDAETQAFIARCRERGGAVAGLLCAGVAELATGLVASVAAAAAADAFGGDPPVHAAEIGRSRLIGGWRVEAPFGQSIVLGFDTDSGAEHSILVELEVIDGAEVIEDLQLAGAAAALLAEAADDDGAIVAEIIDAGTAIERIVRAWEATPGSGVEPGPGVEANERFVANRISRLADRSLPPLRSAEAPLGTLRGMTETEFEAANRAALSTVRAAIGAVRAGEPPTGCQRAWVEVIRGEVAGLTARQREALLWLEWADWLGAGIELHRAGPGSAVDGATLVDHVNRCPEVSSSIARSDRDYAEWAFEVAIEHLADAGVVSGGVLTAPGHAALAPAMVAAWSPRSTTAP